MMITLNWSFCGVFAGGCTIYEREWCGLNETRDWGVVRDLGAYSAKQKIGYSTATLRFRRLRRLRLNDERVAYSLAFLLLLLIVFQTCFSHLVEYHWDVFSRLRRTLENVLHGDADELGHLEGAGVSYLWILLVQLISNKEERNLLSRCLEEVVVPFLHGLQRVCRAEVVNEERRVCAAVVRDAHLLRPLLLSGGVPHVQLDHSVVYGQFLRVEVCPNGWLVLAGKNAGKELLQHGSFADSGVAEHDNFELAQCPRFHLV